MDFNNMVDSHRSQIKFYRASCLALIGVLALLAVVVPTSLKTGPYIIRESDTVSSVIQSEPWKVTAARIEGFLRLYLSNRFEWSKENVDQKRDAVRTLVTDGVAAKLKDSMVSYSTIAKAQNARAYYVLEGFRFSNERRLIDAQVSRIIRVGTTGVVTPLQIRLVYEDSAVSGQNPYGFRVNSIEEVDLPAKEVQ